MRSITYAQALREAQDECLARFPETILMGLGVPDPKGIFGSTRGLQAKYGPARVFDIPLSENAITGVAIGAAITGTRPILTHQRVDFALLSLEQIVNQAAKWHYMFGGAMKVPIVIRMVIGRGWGQGPQHSQSLQAWFGHVPGLKVIMPATPRDAKGLLTAAIEDDNPVVCLEHRWLYNLSDDVPEGHYTEPIGRARMARHGTDVTLVGVSYMTIEALRAADMLAAHGISADVVDLRSIRPLDCDTVLASARKTGRVVVADTGHREFGVSSEIAAAVSEGAFGKLIAPVARVTLPDYPTPATPSLSESYYPRAIDIATIVLRMMGRSDVHVDDVPLDGRRLDQPDRSFRGPF
jgi:pyruvate dehydrogenase E1 component beta subunit